ncbi:MAG: pyrroline-5-carboxylate reductase [Oscillospiraceae bacterium]|nr:pyrroline-5-carboxylate reductase [Oscillospiraceae bacterium]
MKLGFIGCGNMAQAMIKGIVSKEILKPEDVFASDAYKPGLELANAMYGITAAQSNTEVVENADIIVLAVKPYLYEELAAEIKPLLKPEQIVVTIAPGKTLSWMAQQLGENVKVVRSMPNTPSMVGEGMTGVCHNKLVTKEEIDEVCRIMRGFGRVEIVPEYLMDVVVAVSSSSPAYVFMFIEAMADAASADGMTRDQAYQFAAQAVYGSAKMILETHKHPGQLKDMVCQPGGTTLEAIRVLEGHKLRSSIFEAMKACTAHAKKM